MNALLVSALAVATVAATAAPVAGAAADSTRWPPTTQQLLRTSEQAATHTREKRLELLPREIRQTRRTVAIGLICGGILASAVVLYGVRVR